MKSISKKKLAIGALSVVIVASLGFSIYTSQQITEDKEADKKTTHVVNNEDNKKDKKDEKPVHLNPLDGVEDANLSEGKKELDDNEITMTESEVRDLYREYKFQQGVKVLNDLAENSKFTGNAEILKKLQEDGSLLLNITDNSAHTNDMEQQGEGIAVINGMKAFKDPETLLLATLYLDYQIRPHVILYKGSLNPLVEEGSVPMISNITTVEPTHEIKVMYPDTKTLHKIKFTLEGFVLDAYILENKNGALQFYTIEDLYKKAHYYTIEQWEKINKNLKQGKSMMDGVLKMQEESGATSIGEEPLDASIIEEIKASEGEGAEIKIISEEEFLEAEKAKKSKKAESNETVKPQ